MVFINYGEQSIQNFVFLLLIHFINYLFIVACHYRTFQLQGISQFPFFHAERFGKQRKSFNLFVMGKLLLQLYRYARGTKQ